MGNKRSFLQVAEPFEDWGKKAQTMLETSFPTMLDSGHFHGIHAGRNTDAAIGEYGGHRIRGTRATMSEAIYFEPTQRMIDESLLPDQETKKRSYATRVSDAVMDLAAAKVTELMSTQGMTQGQAEDRVRDGLVNIGFFDSGAGQFIMERATRRTRDSILGGMTTPHWDIAVIQKVFRQPFVRGYADRLVNKVGIPNVWADLVQIFTMSFEGAARVSNVAKTMQTLNTSVAVKNSTGTMISQLMNIVIDYESPQIQEQAIGGMPGNWLTNASIGDRDRYANLMLEQLQQTLIYFGHAETGFEGLTQIANRDGNVVQYQDIPCEVLWQQEENNTNSTVGADLLVKFSHMMANAMEQANWLPTSVRMNVPTKVWKVLTFSQLSRVFNQNSPLSVINVTYQSQDRVKGTMPTTSGNAGWRDFEIVPDQMLDANTPFNPNPFDIAFMTFPSIQSELDGGATDLIMAPVHIDKMILPSAPGYRDGVVRTALKRVGSLLVPIEGLVHRIEGIGTNNWYTPTP